MKRQVTTEQDVWAGCEPMYPDLSVTTLTPDPVPTGIVTISMNREYAGRLLSVISRRRDGDPDVSILQRLLEAAFKRT